ncbi:MAG: 4a-hydroxytetrahydrobiopterin dehydratase [Propionibacterium sp.]|nr:4a-hydroxytetrahydrobiopterin dehydratase [Propionibacterium sp.]
MSDPQEKLSPEQIDDAGLTGWSRDGDTIRAHFATGDFATGLRLVDLVGDSAEAANHHPDILLTYPEVSITLSSHDVGGITSRDVDLARTINEHAASLGVPPGQ